VSKKLFNLAFKKKSVLGLGAKTEGSKILQQKTDEAAQRATKYH
jgi:hypothetical protein